VTRYILDTNVLVHIANEGDGWEKILSRMDAAGSRNLQISAATVFEITRMAERAKIKKKVIQALIAMVELHDVVPVHVKIAARLETCRAS
jgi:predicted nucleic acid-binding protein